MGSQPARAQIVFLTSCSSWAEIRSLFLISQPRRFCVDLNLGAILATVVEFAWYSRSAICPSATFVSCIYSECLCDCGASKFVLPHAAFIMCSKLIDSKHLLTIFSLQIRRALRLRCGWVRAYIIIKNLGLAVAHCFCGSLAAFPTRRTSSCRNIYLTMYI